MTAGAESREAGGRTGELDVSEVIDRSRIGPFQVLVVSLCAFVTIIDGYDLVAMGIVVPSMAADWDTAPSAFSPALSAALVGVLFGSALAGRMGDIIGRRWTLILMLAIAAVFMTATAMVESMQGLVVCRFLTGVGAGGSIPVAIAFTAEYVPAAKRNMLIALMYSGAPLGSVIGGVVGPTAIQALDWQGIFLVGGALTALACLALVVALPESLRFLVVRRADPGRIAALVSRIDPGLVPKAGQRLAVTEQIHSRSAWRELFGDGRSSMTLTLWLIFLGNQFVIFFIGLWLPTVFVQGGLSLDKALYVLAVYNLGGAIGGPVCGWLADRYSAPRVLLAGYPVAAVAVALMGVSLQAPLGLYVAAVLAGLAVIGCSICLGGLAAILYPTHVRSTGVGLALGIGRVGSITAPLIGGMVIGLESSVPFFAIAAAGALLCAAGVWALIRQQGGGASPAPADGRQLLSH